MDEREYFEGLRKLQREEALVLYLRCKDISYPEIQRRTGLPEGTSQNRRMTGESALRVLGILQGYCPYLERLVAELGDPPDWDNWPPPMPSAPSAEQKQRETEEGAGLTEEQPDRFQGARQAERSARDEGGSPPPVVEERTNWPRRIIGLVLAALLLLGFWRLLQTVIWDCNPFTSDIACGIVEAPADVPPTDEPPQGAISPDNTPEPTVASEVETQQADEVIQSSTEQPTEVARVATVESSVIPTPSNTPTGTPSPTSMPTPTPTNVYFDDLSDGIDEDIWDVQFGDYEVINGETIFTEEFYMTLGDGTWQDYEVQFRVDNPSARGRANYACVRCGEGRGIVVNYSDGHTPNVWIQENGEWERLHEYAENATDKTLTVRVEGNKIQAWMNEVLFFDYVTDFDSGWVGLKMHPETHLEWIQVTHHD